MKIGAIAVCFFVVWGTVTQFTMPVAVVAQATKQVDDPQNSNLANNTRKLHSSFLTKRESYDVAIASTLGLGIAMQISGIAMFITYNNLYYNTLLNLENSATIGVDGAQKRLNEARKTSDAYFTGALTLTSVGSISTVVGLGLVIAQRLSEWNHRNTNTVQKRTDVAATHDGIASLYQQISSVEFSKHVNLNVYASIPTLIMLSIK